MQQSLCFERRLRQFNLRSEDAVRTSMHFEHGSYQQDSFIPTATLFLAPFCLKSDLQARRQASACCLHDTALWAAIVIKSRHFTMSRDIVIKFRGLRVAIGLLECRVNDTHVPLIRAAALADRQ